MTVFDFVERFILFVIPGVIAYSIFCYLTGKKPLADLLSVSYVFIASIYSFIVGNFCFNSLISLHTLSFNWLK